MNHRAVVRAGAIAALLPVASFLMTASPAAASVTTSGCKNTIFAGAELGWYPAGANSQSALQIGCFFDSRTGSSTVASKFTIHDAKNIQYHDGAARTFPGFSTPAGATCLQTTSDLTPSGWKNRPISVVGDTANFYLSPHTFATAISTTGPCAFPGTTSIELNKPLPHALANNTTLRVENSDSRVVDDGTTAGGSCTVTAPSGNFQPGETGDISGTNIPKYDTYSFASASTVTIAPTCASNAIAHGSEQLTLKQAVQSSTFRTVNDGTCASPPDNEIFSSAAGFTASDVGLTFNTGFEASPSFVVSAVDSPTHIHVSRAQGGQTPQVCTSGPLPFRFTIGEPNATAPADGETLMNMVAQLDVNPTLVPGANACSLDKPETVTLTGTWVNPSLTGPFASGQPTGTKAIGAIQFGNGIMSFNAYVIEREAGTVTTPTDPIGVKHDDIVFPNVPFTSVMCASATSPGLGLSIAVPSATPTQAALQGKGIGKPGTDRLRYTLPKTTTAGFNSVIYFYDDDNPRIWLPAANFNRLCIIANDPAPEAFTCGDG